MPYCNTIALLGQGSGNKVMPSGSRTVQVLFADAARSPHLPRAAGGMQAS